MIASERSNTNFILNTPTDCISHLDPIPPTSAKVQYCGGNACVNCSKCCDWHRDGNGNWQKRAGATCTGYYLTGVCRGLYARRPGPPPPGGFHLEFRHDRDDRVCLCK